MTHLAAGIVLMALCTPALAQTPPLTGGQEPGARAGTSYVPSTHTPGCGGALCDGNDPRLAAPQKPCTTVICGDAPITASEAQRLQEERSRAEAAAVAPVRPAPRIRKARTKTRAPNAVAVRTPAPVEATK